MLKISEAWLRGLQDENRESFKKEVISSKKVLDKLVEILYNMEEGKREVSLPDYDNPSWSHKQAHLNGELAAIRKVIELITIKERADPAN